MAKIDVLIPTYNRPELLPKAVNSILKQTEQDFRIVIWDDCSTTPPPQLPSDARIEYHRSEVNLGVASSRNSLFNLVTAPYACFLDDDDTAVPTGLAKQLAVLESQPAFSVVLCWIAFYDRVGTPVVHGKAKGRVDPKNLRWSEAGPVGIGGSMNFATAFFRKEVTQYRFKQNPKTLGEALLWWNLLLKNGVRFTVVSEYLYNCLIHPGKNSWKKLSADPEVRVG